MLAIIWWAWSGYTLADEHRRPRARAAAARDVRGDGRDARSSRSPRPGAFADDGVLWGARLPRACGCCTRRCSRSPRAATRRWRRAVLSLVVSLIPGAGPDHPRQRGVRRAPTRDLLWVARGRARLRDRARRRRRGLARARPALRRALRAGRDHRARRVDRGDRRRRRGRRARRRRVVLAALLARRRSRARCGGRTSTSSRSSPSTASRRRPGSSSCGSRATPTRCCTCR